MNMIYVYIVSSSTDNTGQEVGLDPKRHAARPKRLVQPNRRHIGRNGCSDDHVKTGLLKVSTTTYLIGILGITKETAAAAAETTSL
jgi:hypothetical protein